MNRPATRVNLHEMDAASWSRLDSILDEVLDLPPDQLGPALQRLCGGDRDLEERLRSILAADLAVEGFLSRTARQAMVEQSLASPAEVDAGLPSLEGRLLGPWRALHPIGQGGMGVVYLGERADGAFEQRVAIKFLGRGIASAALLARFRQERQILARLEHPNIARLVDGGVTGDGLWWFAMEYVDGSPITEWCAARRLPTRAALELFQQACRAVQYAHRNLVVHRDIKPSNILVSGDGTVKLLDFGIAKLLEEPEEGALASTVVMTPNYAAPEQIRGEPPTTATDVYALGVVLYELLTGERPHRGKTGTREDLRHAVLEEEPEAPSARMRRIRREQASAEPGAPAASREAPAASREAPAASREAPAASREAPAARVIPRELDAIVLTAIRKEPERRYSSVEALSDDIARHLEGRPVRASGRTFGYLASKFVRRYRVPLGAVALVLTALFAGLYATARERDRARQEAAKANEIKEFALSLFRVSDPEVGHGANITARELLDRGAARVDRELAGNPRLQAEVWDLLGSVYRSLDLFPQAIATYRKSVAARRASPEHPDTLLAASLRELGASLFENGDYAGGERALDDALGIERRTFGEIHPRVAMVLGELAVLKERTGARADAESLYHRVIAIDSLTIGMENRNTATDVSNLGMSYFYDGRYEEARPYVARALAIREKVMGPRHLDVATGLDQMGMVLARCGEPDSGLALMRRALAIRRQGLAPDHPDIAHSLLNIGSELAQTGQLPEAESNIRQALAIRRRSLDPKDPLIAHTHNELAIVLFREGLLDSAAWHLQEALRIWSYTNGPEYRGILTGRGNLAVIYREQGRYREAEQILRDVLAIRTKELGPDHMDTASTEYHLGRLLVMTHRSDEGEPLLRHAAAVRSAALPAGDPRIAEVQLALGNGLVAMGRVKEGRALIAQCLESAEKRLGPKDRMVVAAKGGSRREVAAKGGN